MLAAQLAALVEAFDRVQRDDQAMESAAESFSSLLEVQREDGDGGGRGGDGGKKRVGVGWGWGVGIEGRQEFHSASALLTARCCAHLLVSLYCLQVGSLEEADKKIDELAASGKLDPALLLMMAKAYAGSKETDITREEVGGGAEQREGVGGQRRKRGESSGKYRLCTCRNTTRIFGVENKSMANILTFRCLYSAAGQGRHGPPVLQGKGELCAAGAKGGGCGGWVGGSVVVFWWRVRFLSRVPSLACPLPRPAPQVRILKYLLTVDSERDRAQLLAQAFEPGTESSCCSADGRMREGPGRVEAVRPLLSPPSCRPPAGGGRRGLPVHHPAGADEHDRKRADAVRRQPVQGHNGGGGGVADEPRGGQGARQACGRVFALQLQRC